MTVTQGQDPERVEQVGVALSALADRVDVVAQTGTSGMGVLGQSWSGPDVESFGQQWQGAHRSLGDASAMLRIVSERHGVAPKMLASSDDLDRIAAEAEQADVPAMQGWRRDVFGDAALKLIRGEMGMKFEKRKIKVFDLSA